MPEELWKEVIMTHEEAATKTIPKEKRNADKAKCCLRRSILQLAGKEEKQKARYMGRFYLIEFRSFI